MGIGGKLAQIGITYGSAIQAGVVAAQITQMNNAIVALNGVVAAGNPLAVSFIVRSGSSTIDLLNGLTLNAADSAAIINNVFQAMQTLNAQYNSALASISIT